MDDKELNRIRAQFQAGQWPQFLEMIEIKGLRGWSGQSINFNFPVVAVVGENGTGKSTVLKAAACAYENNEKTKTYYPSSFFVGTHWDNISGVSFSYRIKVGATARHFNISKPSQRWSFPKKREKRRVYIFDISRTLPLDATVGYAKIAKRAASEISSKFLEEEYRNRLSHILGRDYLNARFALSDVDADRNVGLLQRQIGENKPEISQFHQGAGEACTLDLFGSLQSVPDYSLLIVDEIEASLHPRAQRRLVRFLLWFARNKRTQLILSTHSPYVLEELPQEARVLLMPGPAGVNVVYGVTPEFAMSRIDENVHPELVIFVEDKEAAVLLREILASDSDAANLIARISITAAGPANVVQILGRLAHEKRLHFKSLGIVDGDSQATEGCAKLPSTQSPEVMVFEGLRKCEWPCLCEKFGIGAGTLYGALEDAMRDPDCHRWTTLVGDRVRKSASSVWEILATQWCQSCLLPEDRRFIQSAIGDSL